MSVPCETLASFNFMCEPCESPRDKIKRIKIIHKKNCAQIEFGLRNLLGEEQPESKDIF